MEQRTPVRVLPRRAVLALPALGVLAGCILPARRPAVRRAGRMAAPDPDAAITAVARAGELALLDRYDATLARHPELGPALLAVRDQHAAHLAALPAARSRGRPSPPAVAVPADGAAALRALVAAERTAAGARATECLTASTRLAPLLASIGASEAAHAVALTLAGR